MLTYVSFSRGVSWRLYRHRSDAYGSTVDSAVPIPCACSLITIMFNIQPTRIATRDRRDACQPEKRRTHKIPDREIFRDESAYTFQVVRFQLKHPQNCKREKKSAYQVMRPQIFKARGQ